MEMRCLCFGRKRLGVDRYLEPAREQDQAFAVTSIIFRRDLYGGLVTEASDEVGFEFEGRRQINPSNSFPQEVEDARWDERRGDFDCAGRNKDRAMPDVSHQVDEGKVERGLPEVGRAPDRLHDLFLAVERGRWRAHGFGLPGKGVQHVIEMVTLVNLIELGPDDIDDIGVKLSKRPLRNLESECVTDHALGNMGVVEDHGRRLLFTSERGDRREKRLVGRDAEALPVPNRWLENTP